MDEPMTEALLIINFALKSLEGLSKIKAIIESEGRYPTSEEWEATLGRMDASTSDFLTELERRRSEVSE